MTAANATLTEATAPDALAVSKREGFVDVFRGLLIAHMALDHASLMFNAGRGGEELAHGKPDFPQDIAQFLTRFTGVPVAPGFCFMAGFMVAWTTLAREGRGVSSRDITRRLMIRGLVLILADTILGGLPRALSGYYSFVVLSCIGVSIILIALLRNLPQLALLALALAILFLHPLLDVSGLPVAVRAVLYEPVREGPIRSLYPIIPWFGIVLLGFVIGRDALQKPTRERRWLALAALSLVLFFAFRTLTNYGNAFPHSGILHRDFWYFAKYPPDLPFLTWAFTWVFIALAAVHWICRNGVPKILEPAAVLGRVSFFFYIVHFYLLGPMRAIAGKTNLLGTYVVWIILLFIMYWLCLWYFRKKTLRPNFITRYL